MTDREEVAVRPDPTPIIARLRRAGRWGVGPLTAAHINLGPAPGGARKREVL